MKTNQDALIHLSRCPYGKNMPIQCEIPNHDVRKKKSLKNEINAASKCDTNFHKKI